MVHKDRLESFDIAKLKINSIFCFINRLLHQSQIIIADLKDFSKQVSGLLVQVSSITEVLARDQIKVAFLGRTSSGKSTTLNAILQDEILPMGCGQTTNCFLSVQGSDQPHAYILTAGSNIKRDATSLSQQAHALCDDKLGHSSVVQVFWPKTRCKLLSEHVVLVDSPGIDLSPDLDEWIYKRCRDADVFVLVVNAESTITMTEKKFFHKVNQQLLRPNIFILNNGWEPSASEPDTMELVKKEHLLKNISFLVDELKCVDQAQAEDRVFFVSSKETLMARMQKHKRMPQEGGAILVEGFQARQTDFERFERILEELLSESAIQTKFAPHAMSGLKIAKRMQDIMEQLEGLAFQRRSLLENTKKEQEDRLENIEGRLETGRGKFQRAIEEIHSTVKKQVADAMTETIERVRSLVYEFNHPFHPHPPYVKAYKEELLGYLERELERNMTARSSNSQNQLINDAQRDMAEWLRSVLPQERPENVLEPDATSLDFQASFKLKIRRLCDFFEADIEFHFVQWLITFLAPYLARLGIFLKANPERNDRSFVPTAQNNTMSQSTEEVANSAQCVGVAPVIITRLISVASVATLAIAILKPSYWEYMLFISGFYHGKYIIPSWTNLAKEGALKRQFIKYATERLRLAESPTSTSVTNRVQQTLATTLSKLGSLVQREKKSLEKSLKEMREKIATLEKIESKAKILRNCTSVVESRLSQFITDFGLA